MSLEYKQIRLRLTNDKEILKQLKRNHAIRTDEQGEVLVLQFDGHEYKFRPGKVLTVNHSTGKALIRSSNVIMGDQLVGPVVFGIEEIGSYELGLEQAPEDAAKATSCPICKLNCHTLPRLSRHLMTQHTKDRADLYPEDEKPIAGLDDVVPIEPEDEVQVSAPSPGEFVAGKSAYTK